MKYADVLPMLAGLVALSSAFAEPPVPKIDGPTERNPGALTFLDASGSTGDNFTWLVDTSGIAVPKDGTPDVAETIAALRSLGFSVQEPSGAADPLWAISDDGKRLWLSSYPGVYSVVLGVSNPEGVRLLPWKVKVSGNVPIPIPVPVPVPTPTPVPVPGTFAEQLTAAVKSKPAARVEFERVANSYALIADQIKGGLLTTPQQVSTMTSLMVNFAAGAHAADWQAIDTLVIQPHLKTLGLTTAAQHEGPWRVIAAAVKAGLTDIPPPPDVDPPIPVTSLHVLIIEEMDDRSKLPASQVSVFTSSVLRKWLTDNNAQWRMFDDDVDQSNMEQKWKDAMARPRTSLPWLIASNGTTIFEGPLPKSETEVIAILEKYK